MIKTSAVPPFDPELAPIVESLPIPPANAETLPLLRRIVSDGIPGIPRRELTAGGRVRVDEFSAPGIDGAPDVRLVMLRPAHGEGPWPILYNTHGGGMIIGQATTELPSYLAYVAEGLAAVVAVDYRLAPENPDPAPIDDCYAGLVWTARNATDLSLDPNHIILVGTSAGGGLAAGLALLARDRGFPAIVQQILVCPMLDDRFDTVSSRMLDGFGRWDRNSNEFGWTSLLGDRRGGPDVSIYAAPARAEDLSGLPKTYIDVGSADTFRDEATIYAQRLSEAGVSVDLHVWAGGFHGFDILAPHTALSRAALWVRDDYIRRALAR